MLAEAVQLASLALTQAQSEAPSVWANPLVMMTVMLMIMYFVWLRPVTKERKQHQQMLEALKRGDEVVTQSGMFGRVVDISENIVTLEVAKNVKIRVLKSTVAKRAKDRTEEEKKKAPAKDAS